VARDDAVGVPPRFVGHLWVIDPFGACSANRRTPFGTVVPHPISTQGSISGSVQGRYVDLTIRWDSGPIGHYTGLVDYNDDFAHGDTVDETNPDSKALWGLHSSAWVHRANRASTAGSRAGRTPGDLLVCGRGAVASMSMT
jgi:hypothetical protein